MQAPTVSPPSAPPPARRRRWLRRLLACLAFLLLVLGCAIWGAWWWAGQADSLNRTLVRVAQWLPDDQKLEARGVQGTLREGGSIEWLRWSNPTMQVEVDGADLGWSLRPLLSRAMHFSRVNVQSLRIHSTPGPKDDTPTEPLQSLQLPVRLDVPVRVEHFVWEGAPDIELSALYAHYRYTGTQHELDISSLRYADGLYEAQAKLQTAAPMQIQATLQGQLHTSMPMQPEHTLRITAQASVNGTLATEAARLEIAAQAHVPAEEGQPTDPADGKPLSADAKAVIFPWRAQLLEQADVQLQHINAAWFMPQGPQTDLNGNLKAGPQDQGWHLQAAFTNLLPGPWDTQALPVRQVNASVQFDGHSVWTLESARIDLGSKGDAHIAAQGHFNTSDQVFEGLAELAAINPAELYSSLDPAPLSGRIQARSDDTHAVQFQANLQTAPSRARQHPGLRLGAARLEGTWQAPQLELRNVHLEALEATLTSPKLALNTDTLLVQGAVNAKAPGTHAELQLKASPADGQGKLQLDLQNPQSLLDWLNRLPGLQGQVAGMQLQGSAHGEVQWQGGWEKLQQRLQNPLAPVQASGMRVTASLQAPQLRYQTAEGMDVRLSPFKFSATGSPEALQLNLNAHAKMDKQTLELTTEATVGLQIGAKAQALDWRATLSQLQTQWRASDRDPVWKAALAAPITAQQSTTSNTVQSTQIQVTAGRIAITPPAGEHAQAPAYVVWDPVALRRAGNGSWSVQSKGRLQGLPLMWADVLNPHHPPLAAIGVSGDLMFQGAWDVDTTGKDMRASVVLERESGDIRFAVEDNSAANVTIIRSSGASARSATTNQVQSRAFSAGRGVRARIQDMRLQFHAKGNELSTELLWTTERAGQLSAQLSSQIRHTPDGIVWPDNAPLQGNIRAALPNIGVWAFFAPPGWRVTGSFNADLALSGTRKAPQWSGGISADQLSLQSMLDGVDLRDGVLRAKLQGSRIDITELSLQGGEGSSTRIVGPSGNLTSAPKAGGTLKGSGFIEYDPMAPESSSGLRMDLRAVADHLQVLVRADRQLSISGGLQASLNQGQFKLDGDLTVDRAAIILADDSAPTLGSDVHITSAATRKAEQEKAAKEAAQAGSVQATKPPQLSVKINLGDDFALQGYGITTRLGGSITVTNGPRITGEIHTINGRYRAWGQLLDVEQGTIRFNGPYADPAIDIIAIRPNVDLRVGIKVTGSANNPRVTLFSEPEMSDAEKLSWIVMGRGASGGGAEAALLQQAALAMLSGGGSGGNFASQLGFDEIGFKGPSDDGEHGAALTIGKRLSKDLYVTYEQSLSGAMGTLYIFYDLSRRLTLRAETGEHSAVDLIYTRSKD